MRKGPLSQWHCFRQVEWVTRWLEKEDAAGSRGEHILGHFHSARKPRWALPLCSSSNLSRPILLSVWKITRSLWASCSVTRTKWPINSCSPQKGVYLVADSGRWRCCTGITTLSPYLNLFLLGFCGFCCITWEGTGSLVGGHLCACPTVCMAEDTLWHQHVSTTTHSQHKHHFSFFSHCELGSHLILGTFSSYEDTDYCVSGAHARCSKGDC